MKKIFLSLIVLFAGCNMVDAQTYYYKIISKVNPETGVKSSCSDNMYITFTSNKNVCYKSDQSGNKTSGGYDKRKEFGTSGLNYLGNYVGASEYGCFRECDGVFHYSRSINSMYEYKCYYYDYHLIWGGGRVKDEEGYLYIYFSTDYQRLNFRSQESNDKGEIYVGERSTRPGQASAPTHMY